MIRKKFHYFAMLDSKNIIQALDVKAYIKYQVYFLKKSLMKEFYILLI